MSTITTAAPAAPSTVTVTRAALRVGWFLTAVATLFLGFDALTHLMRVSPVVEANAELGAPDYFPLITGTVLAVCLVAYLIPASRAMGTVLITAYLGGACAVNLVAEQPLFSVAFAIMTAVVVWAGAWPRDDRLRALVGR